MSKVKIKKGKYLVMYNGEEVIMSKECLKDMLIESPDSITIIEKDKSELTDNEKLKEK